jgi:hypothetical protein
MIEKRDTSSISMLAIASVSSLFMPVQFDARITHPFSSAIFDR